MAQLAVWLPRCFSASLAPKQAFPLAWQMQSLITPAGVGCEVWSTDALTDDSPAWWEGWWTPMPANQWWKTQPGQWRLLGHSLRTSDQVLKTFLTHPHPEEALPPDGYCFEEEGSDRLLLHHNAILKTPGDGAGKGGPRFTKRGGKGSAKGPAQAANYGQRGALPKAKASTV